MTDDLFDDLFVFEMANNHQGQVEHGLAIVEACARLAEHEGVRAGVKLQLRDLDTFIHEDFRARDDVPHVPRFLSTRLTVDEMGRLVGATRAAGLLAIATPFDEASVDTCLALGVEILKVASCSATDWPLLEAIAAAGRPVIASTGGLSILEIDNLVSFLRKRVPRLALMHCVSIYPTPDDRVALGFMEKMIRRYPYVRVGYSGHESPDNTDVVVAAVAKGARILERHVGVATEKVSLNAYSMDPEQTGAWVRAARRARSISGAGQAKEVSDEERESLRSLARGVYARKPLRAGQEIGAADVFFAMPCQPGQLSSGDFGHLRARFTASRDYNVNEGVFECAASDRVSELRGILHDAKGQVFEAGIALPAGHRIEVSHHFGLERFREVGCILINLVNREYAEKLIVLLPGQRHPLHRHRRKEETFRCLWGDVELTVNEEARVLEAGDMQLIRRGDLHGFRSETGCILQEISTTHFPDDSEYEDPRVHELDPMQRKTILESW